MANGTGAFGGRDMAVYRQRAIRLGIEKGAQVFEKVVATRHVPRFKVPAGTPCVIRNVITGGDEVPYTTKRDAEFERFERWLKDDAGNFYEFRSGPWIMVVHARYVVRRDVVDRLENHLRGLAAGDKPR